MLLLFSCSDETQQTEEPLTLESVKRNSNNDPFYDLIHSYNALNIQSNRIGTYAFVNDVMSFIQNNADSESIYSQFKQNNIYPCWNCAEPEYFGFHNYYIPFYHLGDSRLVGILVAQEKNGVKSFYYLSKSFVAQITSIWDEPLAQYWSGIMNYFDLQNYPEGRDEIFASSIMPCLWFEDVCGCPDITPTGQLTSSSCHMDDIMNPDCDEGSCPSGSSSTDGGLEDINFYEIYGWIDNDDDIGGSDINGGNNNDENGGGTNTNNDVPNPNWNENCDSYDGSLSTGIVLEVGGETVIDESTGTIALTELEALYELQIANFIKTYGLESQYTPKELMDLLGEKCAVMDAQEVKTCIKCYFISPLGLSNSASWKLADNFDIVADCLSDPDPACIDCKLSINAFKAEFGIQFSSEEEAYILNNIPCSEYAVFSNYMMETLSSTYDEPENVFVCKSSFDNYTPTGDGATIQVECNKLLDIFVTIDFPPAYIETCYDAQDLCITTGNFELDEDGIVVVDDDGYAVPIGMNTRKEFTAQAYSIARYEVHNANKNRYLNGLDFLSQTAADNLFRSTLIQELGKRMTGVSVSTGSCEGSIGQSRPTFNIFGVCLPSFCKC